MIFSTCTKREVGALLYLLGHETDCNTTFSKPIPFVNLAAKWRLIVRPEFKGVAQERAWAGAVRPTSLTVAGIESRRPFFKPLQKAIVVDLSSSDNLTQLTPRYANAPVHSLLAGSFLRCPLVALGRSLMSTAWLYVASGKKLSYAQRR